MNTNRFALPLVAVAASIVLTASAGRVVTSLSGDGWTCDGVPITVPHTWNAVDGADGGANPPGTFTSCRAVSYVRKAATYRRALPDPTRGKRQFVKCEAVSIKATVRVNGREVGRHRGAFTAFCFEVTDFLKASGNVLEIVADNTLDEDVPPIVGDFTMYGGVYRDVWFVETDPVCIDLVTDGADGVVLESDAATGDVVARVSVLGGTNEVQRFHFDAPKLWTPETPHLYAVTVTVAQKGSSDSVTLPFGFRTLRFDDTGFYLNGVKRKFRGVCRHQDREEKGWAVSRQDEIDDVKMMKEMGCDAVRTSHYPQSDGFLDACDRQGLMVWCETPIVNDVTFSEDFHASMLDQTREMIAQRRNHPSIVVWGLFNEIYSGSKQKPGTIERYLVEARDQMHRQDPTRKVVCASNQYGRRELNQVPDFCAFNVYPGWYDVRPWYFRRLDRDGRMMRDLLETLLRTNGLASVGIGEYGAGGSVNRHNDPFNVQPYDEHDDSEEYQAAYHYCQYGAIRDNPKVWGSFLWEMFDSGADLQHEPGRWGCNTKGLVEFDHRTRKDAFYFYKANWNPEPMLHLVGARRAATTNKITSVLGFCNAGDVTLLVNGSVVGTQTPDDRKAVVWDAVALRPGRNEIVLTCGGLRAAAELTAPTTVPGRAAGGLRAGTVDWEFPRIGGCHEGMPFSDGRTGVLVWGGGDTINLTLGRGDLWDHRGGYSWTDEQNYTNIVALARAGDKARLTALFAREAPPNWGGRYNPTLLPLGRVVIRMPGRSLVRGRLDTSTGLGTLTLDDGREVRLVQSKACHAFSLRFPDGIVPEVKAVPSTEFPVWKRLSNRGFGKAVLRANGFDWKLPADPSVSVDFAIRGPDVFVSTRRGDGEPMTVAGFAQLEAESVERWSAFWREGARIKVPDPVVQRVFDLGMYKFGSMTDPDGVPAGLQGPWLEDDRLVPWCGDYHFNINVQECYSPAFRGGHFRNLKPLFDMVLAWRPLLRENARKFVGIDDGYVLPHSVDDRGVCIGGFWTGTIDHASTAWIASLMMRYVRYSGDVAFLRAGAFDFMKGAMKVYRAMMEERGGRLSLPLGPSPEWGADDVRKAVGRDPSFQLAAAHRLARDLIDAAKCLGTDPDPMWIDMCRRLPTHTDGEGGFQVFDGQPFAETHRHHSHMAGLYPFDIVDFSDTRARTAAERTYRTWVRRGPGMWSGWSLPWAAILHIRFGNADAAVSCLRDWTTFFNNPGHGSLHYAWREGFTAFKGPSSIMQMDGQSSSVTAVLEMMAHDVNGKTEFFRGCPDAWKTVSFENVRLSDGRTVSGRRTNGKIEITVF